MWWGWICLLSSPVFKQQFLMLIFSCSPFFSSLSYSHACSLPLNLQLFGALLRGCCADLSYLNLSKNSFAHRLDSFCLSLPFSPQEYSKHFFLPIWCILLTVSHADANANSINSQIGRWRRRCRYSGSSSALPSVSHISAWPPRSCPQKPSGETSSWNPHRVL